MMSSCPCNGIWSNAGAKRWKCEDAIKIWA